MNKRIALLLACLLCLCPLLPAASADGGSPLLTCGRFRYRLLEDDSAAITGMAGGNIDMGEDVAIPEELDGHPVTQLLGLTDYFGAVDSLSIPAGVTVISPEVLEALSFCAIEVSPDNPVYETVGGVLFSRQDRCLLLCPLADVDVYAVPEGTAAIADYAFRNTFVSTVVIPDSVVTVGRNPFRSCSSLKEIRISPSHPALSLTDGMLFSKEDQRLICRLPDDRVSCVVPAGTRIIGDFAFSGSLSLQEIVIPDSVAAVSGSAFADCIDLAGFTVSASNPELEVVDGVLFSRSDRRLVAFPRARRGWGSTYSAPKGTLSVGDYAFCLTSLDRVTLPKGLTAIGDRAFDSCPDLQDVVLPESLTTIGEGAFSGCTGLREIKLPAGVTSVSPHAFQFCMSLSSVSLPRGIETVGAGAFSWCEALTAVTFPDTLTEIGNYAFFSASSLAVVAVPGNTAAGAGVFDRCENVVVHTPSGSAMDRYCRECGIPVAP